VRSDVDDLDIDRAVHVDQVSRMTTELHRLVLAWKQHEQLADVPVLTLKDNREAAKQVTLYEGFNIIKRL